MENEDINNHSKEEQEENNEEQQEESYVDNEDNVNIPPPPPPIPTTPGSGSVPPPPPIQSVTANQPRVVRPDASQLQNGAARLQSVVVVEKKKEEDPRSELERRVLQQGYAKLDLYKEQIRALVHKINNAKFRHFRDARQLNKEVKEMEDNLANVDTFKLLQFAWPIDKISALRDMVIFIDLIDAAISSAEKAATAPKKDLNYMITRWSELQRLDFMFSEVNKNANLFGQPLTSEMSTEKRSEAEKAQLLLLTQFFQIAFEKATKTKQARTKFDLTNGVREAFRLLNNAITYSNQVAQDIRPKDLVKQARDMVTALVEEHGSILNMEVTRLRSGSGSESGAPKAVFAKVPERPKVSVQLHNAVLTGKIESVLEALQDTSVSVDGDDNKGNTPLLLAVQKGFKDIVSLLLERGANISWTDVKGNSYLHVAVSASKPEIVQLLLEKGAFPDPVNSFKETPLHLACSNKEFEIIKVFARNKANLLAKDMYDKTPLFNFSVKYFNPVVPSPKTASWGLDMSRYLNNKTLSDVAFIVEGTKFWAHRIVLCSQSGAFRSLLEGEWKESHEAAIELPDVNSVAFKHMLEYCYTGEARIPKEDVTIGLQLLATADRFMLDPLKKNCEYLLSSKITLENAYEIFTSSTLYNAPALRGAAAHFILQNYEQIAFADEDFEILFSIIDQCKLLEQK